jgi:hypothetical protein
MFGILKTSLSAVNPFAWKVIATCVVLVLMAVTTAMYFRGAYHDAKADLAVASARLAANEAALNELREDRDRNYAALSQRIDELRRNSASVETIRRQYYAIATSNACVSSPAFRAFTDGLRDATARGQGGTPNPSPGTPRVPGRAPSP